MKNFLIINTNTNRHVATVRGKLALYRFYVDECIKRQRDIGAGTPTVSWLLNELTHMGFKIEEV